MNFQDNQLMKINIWMKNLIETNVQISDVILY
jgi:hypothetical protein